MTEVVVGLDLGSSSIKAIAYDVEGRTCGVGTCATPFARGAHGGDFPVGQVLAAARGAVRAAGQGHRVVAIGLTSMGEVGAVLSGDGALTATTFPAWHDDRGAELVQRMRAQFGEQAHARTGGHLRTTSSLAKLAWVNDHCGALEGTFLGLCGLLAHQWTGQAWQEPSLAATSGAFDPVAGQWLPQLWDAAGLGRVALPQVGVGIGKTACQQHARDDGVDGALVVIAGHDHPVAAVGTGSSHGFVVDSLGTGEPVLAAWSQGRPTPTQAAALVADGLTIETWPGSELPLLIWEGLRPGLAMETFLRACGRSREELEGVSILTAAALSRVECAALESGDSGPLDRRELSRADAVGWAQAWADLLDAYARDAAAGEARIRAATGAAGPLVLTGGGTRSQRWLAAKTGRTRSEIRISAVPNSGCRGAAALAGTALGWWKGAELMPKEDNV